MLEPPVERPLERTETSEPNQRQSALSSRVSSTPGVWGVDLVFANSVHAPTISVFKHGKV
jgi:hypothetical protein